MSLPDPDWIQFDEGTSNAPGVWSVSAGELVQTSNIYSSGSPAFRGTYLYYEPGLIWSDVSIEYTQTSTDNDAIGIMFCYVDNDNYCRYSEDAQRTSRLLVIKSGGVYTTVRSDSMPYTVGVPQTVKLVAVGTQIQVFVNNVLLWDIPDAPSPASGTIAPYGWANNGMRFDNILVTDPTP